MEYKNFVTRRIPSDLKGKDRLAYNLLLSVIRENSVRTTEQLSKHIGLEIEQHRIWLAKNRAAPTLNRLRRQAVQKLEHFNNAKGLLDKYLK